MSTLGLVSCCLTKGPVPAPAKDLYLSRTFKIRREWVEHTCDRWLIISSKLGVIPPDQIVEPYDEWLRDNGTASFRAFQERVLAQLQPYLPGTTKIIIHAGAYYYNPFLANALRSYVEVETPTFGMSNLQTFSWLKTHKTW